MFLDEAQVANNALQPHAFCKGRCCQGCARGADMALVGAAPCF
ncbi:hypothetical protein [Pyrobaculum sp.]